MSTEDSLELNEQDVVKMGTLAFDNTVSQNISRELLGNDQLFDQLEVVTGDLNNLKGFYCDIAMVMLGHDDDFKVYTEALSTLKLVSKVPVVLAVIDRSHTLEADLNVANLSADKILKMPMNSKEFGREIKTQIAALKLFRQKENSLGNKAAQAKSLGAILVENDVITSVQLKQALEHQKKGGNTMLGDTLVHMGFISEEQKVTFLASQLGVDKATPKQYASADMNIVAYIPEMIAREYQCIALELRPDDTLIVAMVDISDLSVLDIIRDRTDKRIQPILGTRDEIEVSIKRYYADISSHKDASNLMADLGDDIEIIKEEDEGVDLDQATAEGAELGIIKLVNMLISNSIRDRASDIHIEPMEHSLSIRYRIDGELRPLMSPPKHSHTAIVTRIKILCELDIAERRLPQDGRMAVRMKSREVDVRVSILPTVHGEKVVMRILDKEAFEKSTSNLGFSEYEQKVFKNNISRPYGMVVVTGPTGSGKSTTLYSALQTVKNNTINIITVEDPVEFQMEGINQVHVNSKVGLTFAAALRSILRQDPDVILIGEIRDAETADIATKMALTGHMVFSTLHTNTAAAALTRFVDIGIPPLLLASSLNLIIGQRLVRRICEKCKVEYKPEEALLTSISLKRDANTKFYKGEGCVSCHGVGFQGRIGLFEMLQVTKEIREMILANASTIALHDKAVAQGMKTMQQAGFELVLSGDTTIEQVLAVTTEN